MRVTKEQFEAMRTRTQATTRQMRVLNVVGIDPGTHTGFAWLSREGVLQVNEFTFWSAWQYINDTFFPSNTILVIEQGGLNSPLFSSVAQRMEAQARAAGRSITPAMRESFRRAENKHAMNVGAANEQAELLIAGFRLQGFYVETFRPVANKKWKTHEQAVAHTGIKQRTNDHNRVALQAVWDYRHLLKAEHYEYK